MFLVRIEPGQRGRKGQNLSPTPRLQLAPFQDLSFVNTMMRCVGPLSYSRQLRVSRALRSSVQENALSTGATLRLSKICPTWSTSWQGPLISTSEKRWYTPMTPEDEEIEKARVSHLSPEDKEKELREMNRKIAFLEMKRGINTGDLYTWSGRYKALMRDYGFPLFVYYWAIWSTTGISMYLAIDIGGLDAMEVLAKVDSFFGWSLQEKVDPQMGKIGLALVMNEMVEPVRLPFVVATLKPAMEFINPPKF